MPYPQQTFATIDDLIAYVNNNIVTNGAGEIDAIKANNPFNGLANFIKTLPLNYEKATVTSGGGANTPLTTPITVFVNAPPTSIYWAGNLQNCYYIVNTTTQEIPIATGYYYKDINLVVQHGIPAQSVVTIAKTSTDQWIQINNPQGAGGGLPTQTGHDGQSLFTNGVAAQWLDGGRYVTSTNFESDGKTVLLPDLENFGFFIFWNDIPRYLYEGAEWEYVAGGGFMITLDGFDASAQDVNIFLTLKGNQ